MLERLLSEFGFILKSALVIFLFFISTRLVSNHIIEKRVNHLSAGIFTVKLHTMTNTFEVLTEEDGTIVELRCKNDCDTNSIVNELKKEVLKKDLR